MNTTHTLLSTTLHQHIVKHLDIPEHSYEDFLQIVKDYCVINRNRPNEEPLRLDTYEEDGVTIHRLDINACHLITSGYPRSAGALFRSVDYLFNGTTSEEYLEWLSVRNADRTLTTGKGDNVWAKEETYFTHPVSKVRHPAVSSRDITNMINKLAGWDGKGKSADHNRLHPKNQVKAIEDKTVMRNIRKYITTMLPNLCKKAGVEMSTDLYSSAVKAGVEGDTKSNRPLPTAVHQPLGYFDIGVAMYTSSINQQQKMLVMTPDLAEVVCSIFNPRVVLQMQQELLRLRALIANTNMPPAPIIPLSELNGTDTPPAVVQATPMLQAYLACYSIQQAIDTFGDQQYDKDKLDTTRDRHVEYPTSTTENGLTVNTYSTNVWQCAYRLVTHGWKLPEYAINTKLIN